MCIRRGEGGGWAWIMRLDLYDGDIIDGLRQIDALSRDLNGCSVNRNRGQYHRMGLCRLCSREF